MDAVISTVVDALTITALAAPESLHAKNSELGYFISAFGCVKDSHKGQGYHCFIVIVFTSMAYSNVQAINQSYHLHGIALVLIV